MVVYWYTKVNKMYFILYIEYAFKTKSHNKFDNQLLRIAYLNLIVFSFSSCSEEAVTSDVPRI